MISYLTYTTTKINVYRAYVLEEEDMKKVVKKQPFFIQLDEENEKIFSYTTKAWQHRLTRRLVTHSSDPHTGLSSLILTAQEEQLVSTDWEEVWSNMRCPGLSPKEQTLKC